MFLRCFEAFLGFLDQKIPLLAPVISLCSRFLHQLEYGDGARGNSNILLQLIRILFTRSLRFSLSVLLYHSPLTRFEFERVPFR